MIGTINKAPERSVNYLRHDTTELRSAMLSHLKTHCVHGHEYTPENTRIHNGRRECWTCVRLRDQARRSPEYWRTYRAERKQRDPEWRGKPLVPPEMYQLKGPAPIPARERFWALVGEPDANGCRPWLGATSKGYGRFSVETVKGRSRQVMAHRWLYEDEVGPIPEGYEIDHVWPRCLRRDCVEKTHLEPVTGSENVKRAKARMRAERRLMLELT